MIVGRRKQRRQDRRHNDSNNVVDVATSLDMSHAISEARTWMTSVALANLEEEASGFDFGCVWSCEYCYTPSIEIQNKYEPLTEDEQDMFVLDESAVMGRITIDSRAAESVWATAMPPKMKRKTFLHDWQLV